MPRRNIAAEIKQGLSEYKASLTGGRHALRTTIVKVPQTVDVRVLRTKLGLTQAEFSFRYGIPLQTLRRWERGERQPDSTNRAYLTVIERDPGTVAKMLQAA